VYAGAFVRHCVKLRLPKTGVVLWFAKRLIEGGMGMEVSSYC